MLIEIAHTELHGLILLPKAVGCRNLIVEVNLLLIEDENVSSGDHIASWVNQVAMTVHHTPILVVKFAIGSLKNYRISLFIWLEFT